MNPLLKIESFDGPSSIEALKRSNWLPVILTRAEERGWRRYFRTCRPCPDCRHDLSGNGKGSYRCPACGYSERLGRPCRTRQAKSRKGRAA
jgi:tRNA(Ile2) C34 agmatinyltransferase TiaS